MTEPEVDAERRAALPTAAEIDATKDPVYFSAPRDIGPWPQIPVTIIEASPSEADRAVAAIVAEAVAAGAGSAAPYIVGIDMEWVTFKRTGKAKEIPLNLCDSDYTTEQVAMVQVATATHVYLFRTCAFRANDPVEGAECALPKCLADFLRNENGTFVFAGVGVDGDRNRFARDFDGVAMTQCLDIVKAARLLAVSADALKIDLSDPTKCHARAAAFVAVGSDAKSASLADYAGAVFGFALPKDIAITCSNWTKRRLDEAQVYYAAADAFASRQLASTMMEVFRPSMPLPQLCASSTPLKPVKERKAKAPAGAAAASAGNNGQGKKPDAAGAYSGRKQPYYGNIKVLEAAELAAENAREPRVLFTVSVNKAEWYVKEGLALVVRDGVKNDDGTYTGRVIQLKFQPNLDRGEEDRALRPDNEFFAADKENCCVVCGADEPPGGVVRFFVVPQAYRKFFPREFVNHNSFDIVLVCVSCMKRVNVVYEAERKRLEEAFKYPISWHSAKSMSQMRRETSDDKSAAQADGDAAAPGDGIAIAEHNRTILNVGKSATALVMAVAAGESVSAATRAKNKTVNLPPDRFAALVESIDAHLPAYIFPDVAADIEANGGTEYKPGKPHWQDRYWNLLKDKCGSAASLAEPIVLPTTGEAAPNRISWRDVYNVMRADRWKVRLRASVVQNPDSAASAAPSPSTSSMGASHFEFVVNEIIRAAIEGAATVGGIHTRHEPRDAPPDEREWLRARVAASGGALGAPKDPKSGKPGRGPDTPRCVLEAICRFIYRWRTMFQSQMQPKRMPQGWYPRQGLIGIDGEASTTSPHEYATDV